ncbi:ribosomal protein L36, component of cytosolic 80S ribosome and 60S large subunit [Planoprotostelium fungivorum]|uniref:60S ribosomal protein L36 n=1 Tax=Planoprotostelium fungivorum TaxID=1890364 RepID=A0A2P6NJZ6_9EUKA|nr:ribosomal protein L36, component of cytosolic 80S ribosome and 60S large subunit [Planoprotostelium fungivorum]
MPAKKDTSSPAPVKAAAPAKPAAPAKTSKAAPAGGRQPTHAGPLAVGLKKGFKITKRTESTRNVHKKGQLGKQTKFVRELIREVSGLAPYERRVVELLRNGLEKRAVKLAKRKLGTLRRGKAKYTEIQDYIRKLREQRQADK